LLLITDPRQLPFKEGIVKIVCPTCNTAYAIPDRNIPTERTLAPCKKCGGKILAEPNPAAQGAALTAPSIFPDHYPQPSPITTSQPGKTLAIFSDYPELQSLDSEKVDFEEILTPTKDGRYKSRKNNLKIRILKAIRGALEKALQDGEKVLRIGRGTAYYPAEIFFGNGFLTMLYNHYAIVGTDQRLLFININSRIDRPTHYFFQMLYKTIKKVNRGFFGSSLTLYPMRGKRRTFLYVKGYMSKELKELILAKRNSIGSVAHPYEPLEPLCPSCFAPLRSGLVRCPSCQVDFKEPRKALLRSLLLPGLGDIYLGHRSLGVLELMGAFLLWGVVILAFLTVGKAGLLAALLPLLLYNGLDGLLTYHMARKGYMLSQSK
jgi:predicted Zn finger-like uncharacterized protein